MMQSELHSVCLMSKFTSSLSSKSYIGQDIPSLLPQLQMKGSLIPFKDFTSLKFFDTIS